MSISNIPVSPITLASSSPRRLQLLEQIYIVPEQIVSPKLDETPYKQEKPRIYVTRIAKAKLQAGQELAPSASFILTADTIVAVGHRILNQPKNQQEAEAQLQLLSGRRHRVYTAVAFLNTKKQHHSFRLVQIGRAHV